MTGFSLISGYCGTSLGGYIEVAIVDLLMKTFQSLICLKKIT